jgi:tripartite-type tricarboxylate transporter receptor subunit TctC
VLFVNPEVAAMSVKDLVNLAKKSPGQLSFASAGAGSVPHLARESLRYLANIDVIHVPYKGGGPATIDLLGGRVSFAFLGLAPIMGHIESGKLRARDKQPTSFRQRPGHPNGRGSHGMAQLRLQQLDRRVRTGLYAPATIAKLQEAMAAAVASPEVRSKLGQQGIDPVGTSTEEFNRFWKQDVDKYARIIKAAGVEEEN